MMPDKSTTSQEETACQNRMIPSMAEDQKVLDPHSLPCAPHETCQVHQLPKRMPIRGDVIKDPASLVTWAGSPWLEGRAKPS